MLTYPTCYHASNPTCFHASCHLYLIYSSFPRASHTTCSCASHCSCYMYAQDLYHACSCASHAPWLACPCTSCVLCFRCFCVSGTLMLYILFMPHNSCVSYISLKVCLLIFSCLTSLFFFTYFLLVTVLGKLTTGNRKIVCR